MRLKKLAISLIAIALMLSTFQLNHAEASTPQSPAIGGVYDWILDEQAGYIYIINMSNELLFLNKRSLKIDSKINLESEVLDMKLYEGRLYVSTVNDLRVVDVPTKKVIKTYLVRYMLEMAVHDGQIYYVSDDTYSPVYKLDLQTEKLEKVPLLEDGVRERTTYEPTITIDPVKDILYVANSGLSGSHVYAYRLSDYTLIGKTNYNNGRGFSYPHPSLHYDKGDVFFASFKLDGNHLPTIHGQYRMPNEYETPVINVFKNYVVTDYGIFNRHTYEFEIEAPGDSVLIDSQNYMYLYTQNNTIMKQHINQYLDTNPTYLSSENMVEFSYPITEFITDHESGYIFAISEQGQRLYYIRMSDMKVVNEIMIGSRPVDVNVMNGKVYVALFGATKIAVTSVPYNGSIQHINIEQNPYQLEAFNNKLVYANNNNFQQVMMYDVNTKEIKNITSSVVSKDYFRSVDSPDFAYDKKTNRLFISETNTSNAELVSVDGTTLTNIDIADSDYGYGTGFPNPRYNQLYVNNGEVFIHRFVIDANDLSVKKGAIPFTNMSEEIVVGVTKDYIFSTTSIYGRTNFKKIVIFPYKMTSVKEVEETNELFVYSDDLHALVKYPSAADVLAGMILFGNDAAPALTKEFLSYRAVDLGQTFAFEEIYNFMQADLVEGFIDKDGTVRVKPNDTITRAQFVAILVRALGLKDTTGAKQFQDVKSTHWFYPYVQKATALGILDGVSTTHFAPGREIRRDEIAKLVVRAFEKSVQFSGTSKEFSDVSNKHWSKPYIDKASRVGIINGFTSTTFAPTQNATRAQAIVMLSRGLNLEKSNVPTDTELLDSVLAFQNSLGDLISHQKYTEATNLIHNETTGYYRHFNLYNIATIKYHLQKGITIDFTKNDELQASIIKKTNQFAIVRLSGAAYTQTYTKGDFSYSSDQDTSGLVYLIKDANGKWKIYRYDIGA